MIFVANFLCQPHSRVKEPFDRATPQELIPCRICHLLVILQTKGLALCEAALCCGQALLTEPRCSFVELFLLGSLVLLGRLEVGDLHLERFLLLVELASFHLYLVGVLQRLVYDHQAVSVGPLLILFDYCHVLPQRCLGGLEVALEPLDLCLVHHFIVGLLEL